MENQNKNNYLPFSIILSLNFIATIIMIMVLKELQNIFIPLVLATFMYFIFSPLNKYLKDKKLPNALIVITNILILIFIGYIFTQIVYTSFDHLFSNIDTYAKKFNRILLGILNDLGIKKKSFYSTIENFDWKGIIISGISTTLNVFNLLFFTIFFYIFIYFGAEDIVVTLRKYLLPNRSSENFNDVKEKFAKTFNNIIEQVQKYLYVKFTNNLFAGITATIVLYALGLDYPIIWGLLLFVFEFIPTIGSIISISFPILMSIIQRESLGYTILVALSLIGVLTLVYSVIEPKRMGDRLGINPLFILISLLLWNYIWGIPGMILSIPIMATIKIILENTNSKTLNFISEIIGNK